MRVSKMFMVFMFIVVFSLAAGAVVTADDAAAASAAEVQLLGYMEQIAEDIEEIHHDMHKVAFALRLSAYSQGGIAVILLLMLILKAAALRRR